LKPLTNTNLIPGVTGALLAGGASRRMGTDKATLAFAGGTLGGNAAHLLQQLFNRVLVVERADQQRPQWPTSLVRVCDPKASPQAALSGIASALKAADTPWVFIMACDMPTPSAALIRGLCSAALSGPPGTNMWVPETGGVFHPLHAVYHCSLLAPIEATMAAGNLRVQGFARRFGKTIPEAQLRIWNPDLSGLDNLNTPEALAAARQRQAHQ
jgi:molybdopterin-guanine dinucleotide biosynthesis protein A